MAEANVGRIRLFDFFSTSSQGFSAFSPKFIPRSEIFFQRAESFPQHVDKIGLFASKLPHTKEKTIL